VISDDAGTTNPPERIYEMDIDRPVAGSLNRAFEIARVLAARPAELFSGVDDELISLILVGDPVRMGGNEERNVEFIAITDSDETVYDPIHPVLGERLGMNVNIHHFHPDEWESMVRGGTNSPILQRKGNYPILGDPLFFVTRESIGFQGTRISAEVE